MMAHLDEAIFAQRQIPIQSVITRAQGSPIDLESSTLYPTKSGEIVVQISGNIIPYPDKENLVTRAITITVSSVEPVIPRTTIPLYRVSALLEGGMSIIQVLEDFPSLTAVQVEYARAYAAIYPNLGKPYPKTSFKRLLRNAGFYAAQKDEVVKKAKNRQPK